MATHAEVDVSAFHVGSESGTLETVAVHHPQRTFQKGVVRKPEAWRSRPDQSVLNTQVDQYMRTLQRYGVHVIDLSARVVSYPQSAFMRDIAVVVGGTLVICDPPDGRYREAEVLAAYAAEQGWPYLRCPYHLEGGDLLRHGRRFYVGYGRRTAFMAVNWLATRFPAYDWVPVEREGPERPVHFRGGHRVVGDVLIERTDVERVPYWPGLRVEVKPTEEVVEWHSFGFVMVHPGLCIIGRHCPQMERLLGDLDVRTVSLQATETREMGGSLERLTLPLQRQN